MKIGIEAKWLFRGPPSGCRVVRNLVGSLLKAAGDDELHLILDARSRSQAIPAGLPADRCHYVWGDNNQLANVFVVPRLADRLRLDAVVYQTFSPPSATRHARVAFVHDVIFASHPEYFTRGERMYFLPLRYLASRADRVCTVSASERERLVRFGYAHAGRVDVVPNGVDESVADSEELPASTRARMLEQLGARGRFVLYVGRLNVRKNVSALVRAMAYVRDPNVSLLIVGAPDRTSVDLQSVAHAAGVAPRIRMLGAVSDVALRVLYGAATVFCYPSLDEGFGLCPLEAMASGAPTVVSNVPVFLETCGDAAVFVDPTDPAAIGSTLQALITDTARMKALKIAGRTRARSFSWDRSATLLLDAVHTAVEDVRAGRA